MNREYRKFDPPTEIYIPLARGREYLRHLPDVLIPSDYEESDIDPLERDAIDIIAIHKTPPPTPPEMEPGRAGFHIIRGEYHFVHPIFSIDEEYKRRFSVKLILGQMAVNFPSLIILALLASAEYIYCPKHVIFKIKAPFEPIIEDDNELNTCNSFEESRDLWAYYGIPGGRVPVVGVVPLVVSIVMLVVYSYFVGLFRNSPFLEISIAIRTLITMAFYFGATVTFHGYTVNFITNTLQDTVESDVKALEGEEIESGGGVYRRSASINSLYQCSANAKRISPPYLFLLALLLYYVVQGVIIVFIWKYKYTEDDYRIPFTIYTVCGISGAALITITLNKVFKHCPEGYDVFQVVAGTSMGSFLLMRTPYYLVRLYEGRICVLTEYECKYALLHFGM